MENSNNRIYISRIIAYKILEKQNKEQSIVRQKIRKHRLGLIPNQIKTGK